MLYLVGTPIGNLKEITQYAIEILNNADYILCEDTRTSSVLLNHYDIKKPLKSYHKFNERESEYAIIKDLQNGKNIALISDAGMPGISDPGNVIVRECIKYNLEYTVVSGPSALINAFILSGFDTPFTFAGFLPDKLNERNNMLMQYKEYYGSLIFYMSCHDIDKYFDSLYKVFGNKPVCVVRELTKMYEEKIFTTLAEGYHGDTRGEFVLIVDNKKDDNKLNDLSIKEHLLHYINLGASKQDAIKYVCADRNIKKQIVYKEAIDL